MAQDEKRAGRRAPIVLRIKLRYPDVDTFIERFATNISHGGMFIASQNPRPEGTQLHFELRLADDSTLIKGAGVVRWARPQDPEHPRRSPGMGIEFRRLTSDSLTLIDRIIEYRRSHGYGDDAIPNGNRRATTRGGAGTATTSPAPDAAEPASAPTPEPASAPTTEPASAPASASAPEPEPASAPTPEPASAPASASAPEPEPERIAPLPPPTPPLPDVSPIDTTGDARDMELDSLAGGVVPDLQTAIARARQLAFEDDGGSSSADLLLADLLRVRAAPVAESVDDASHKLALMLGGRAVPRASRTEAASPIGRDESVGIADLPTEPALLARDAARAGVPGAPVEDAARIDAATPDASAVAVADTAEAPALDLAVAADTSEAPALDISMDADTGELRALDIPMDADTGEVRAHDIPIGSTADEVGPLAEPPAPAPSLPRIRGAVPPPPPPPAAPPPIPLDALARQSAATTAALAEIAATTADAQAETTRKRRAKQTRPPPLPAPARATPPPPPASRRHKATASDAVAEPASDFAKASTTLELDVTDLFDAGALDEADAVPVTDDLVEDEFDTGRATIADRLDPLPDASEPDRLGAELDAAALDIDALMASNLDQLHADARTPEFDDGSIALDAMLFETDETTAVTSGPDEVTAVADVPGDPDQDEQPPRQKKGLLKRIFGK